MQPTQNQPQQSPAKKGGYGKRPVWQWVVIYVIAAVVVYGVAYVAYRHYHKTTVTNPDGTTTTTSGGGLY